MTRFSLVSLLIGAALPAIAVAQATAPAAPAAPQSVTRAQVSAKLDADYANLDTDHNGKVTRVEVEKRIATENTAELAALSRQRDESFRKLDANNNGSITRAEFDAVAKLPAAPTPNATPVLTRFDTNKDGVITAAEYRGPTLANFDSVDTNKDGTVSAAEQQAAAGR